MNLRRATRVLLACIAGGAALAVGGFFIAASNVGFFGESHGPLLGLGAVMLIAGVIAFAAGIIGLVAVAVAALVRRRH